MTDLVKLDEALDWIRAHPEEHDQSTFFSERLDGCGTTRCLAGVVAMQAGWLPRLRSQQRETTEVVSSDGLRTAPAADVAAGILDLTGDEKEALFYIAGSLQDLEDARDVIATGGDLWEWECSHG